MKYEIILEIDLSAIHPSAKDIESSVNKSMSSFGFDEKMVIRTELPLTLTTNKVMTKQEEDDMFKKLYQTFNDRMPSFNAKIKSFSRIS